jgi:hypothetical protein
VSYAETIVAKVAMHPHSHRYDSGASGAIPKWAAWARICALTSAATESGVAGLMVKVRRFIGSNRGTGRHRSGAAPNRDLLAVCRDWPWAARPIFVVRV